MLKYVNVAIKVLVYVYFFDRGEISKHDPQNPKPWKTDKFDHTQDLNFLMGKNINKENNLEKICDKYDRKR